MNEIILALEERVERLRELCRAMGADAIKMRVRLREAEHGLDLAKEARDEVVRLAEKDERIVP